MDSHLLVTSYWQVTINIDIVIYFKNTQIP